MFDYETLRFIWWLLIGVILVVFMISDGFDMGIGCLLPLVARDDDERRIVINSVGAHWEGNQVWLILAGGALFAAWSSSLRTSGNWRCKNSRLCESCAAWRAIFCCK